MSLLPTALLPLSKENENGNIIIVGCGRLGATLANTLSAAGHGVFVVDINPQSFRKLSPSFGGITITGDATDVAVLVEAQIHSAHAVILVTNDDNINIYAAQIAAELFHPPHIISRLYDPECEMVYHEFGINTICPSVLSAREVNKILSAPHTSG